MSRRPTMGRRTLGFLCCVLAMPTCTQLLPGIRADKLETALLAGVLLGFVYLLLRPALRILTLPIGCLTMGLFNFVLDAALILLLPQVFPGFQVDGFAPALLAALLVDGLCMVAGGLK